MLIKLSIEKIRNGIAKREFSYHDLIAAYYKQFQRYQYLNAHISEYWEESLKKAQRLDNEKLGTQHLLRGIPIAIKDLFLTKGQKTTAGSKMLENFIAPYESHVTQQLLDAEYIMTMKANLDEFAMGSSNETSAFGPAINPWILNDRASRSPGGSSGGSAAAVAAYMSLGALGSDTGGSIRQPAAFCGLVGFKPTYGRCSRRGMIAHASSLDHPGVIARSVQDAVIILETIAGHDVGDSTSLDLQKPQLSNVIGEVKGKKIGIVVDAFATMTKEYIQHFEEMIRQLKAEGAIIIEIGSKELPNDMFNTALNLYGILSRAEAASNLARYDGIRYGIRGSGSSFEEILLNSRQNFGTEVKRRILIGNFVLAHEERVEFFDKAIKCRAYIRNQMNEIFSRIDALLLPTTPGIAFPLGSIRDPIEMYNEDLYTVLANIYGGPCMQLPLCLQTPNGNPNPAAQTSQTTRDQYSLIPSQIGLPIGLQIMAANNEEATIVKIAKKIEQIVNWKGLEL
jgi:aspartyl-tRNA(Asn)/glutamyl-tRNA(Gln) amidotransferase subunit A